MKVRCKALVTVSIYSTLFTKMVAETNKT